MEVTSKDVQESISKLEGQFGLTPDAYVIIVDPEDQKMYLIKNRVAEKVYSVATSRFGIGNIKDSYKTPTGVHRVKEKIGDGAVRGMAFNGRKPVRIAKIAKNGPKKVWGAITSRIMWLDGQEPGVNTGKNDKGQSVDSHERFIYIHGTANEWQIGAPASIGCVEMKNDDIIELFNIVPEGTLVEILNKEYKKK